MIQAPSGPQYQEEIPRCQPHVIARQMHQARSVLDAYGQACMAIRPADGGGDVAVAAAEVGERGGRIEHPLFGLSSLMMPALI